MQINSTKPAHAHHRSQAHQPKAGPTDSFEGSKVADSIEVYKKLASQMKAAAHDMNSQLVHKAKHEIRRQDYLAHKVDLTKIDPSDTHHLKGDDETIKLELDAVLAKLDKLQKKLNEEHKHSVLFVMQGTDTAGKDGVIKSVTRGMNPAGVTVHSFKKPSQEELDHPPLWRIIKATPGKGEITFFNRSQYEDVLPTRVHGLIDAKEAAHRLKDIQAFESALSQEGTTVVKFFLHIDKATQKERLEARRDTPGKEWKLSPDDLTEREHWDEYQKYDAEAINATSTKAAPWYVVPSDDKLRRDLIVATIMLKTLEDLDIQPPQPTVPNIHDLVIK